jgi:hypothetical protein
MKVIFIAQHIIPMPTPRAHRTFELAKEFSRNGHDVTIYAVLGDYDYSEIKNKFNLQIINIPIHFQIHSYNSDNDGKRLFIDKVFGKLLGKIAEFPNIEFLFRVTNLVRNEPDADLFITIADPHHIHWGMARAKRKLGNSFRAKWIADCGDPFMANGKSKDHLKYFSRFEHDFCQQADFITIPVEHAKNEYFQEYKSKLNVIPQGFFFELDDLKKKFQNSPRIHQLNLDMRGYYMKPTETLKNFLKHSVLRTLNLNFIFSAHITN